MNGGYSNTPHEVTGYRAMSPYTVPCQAYPEYPIGFGTHWLAGSLEKDPYFSVSDFFDLVRKVFDTEFVDLGHGLNGWRRCLQGVGGIKLLLEPSTNLLPIAHLIVPGEACEAVGLKALQQLVVLDCFRLTRLDLAFDHCPFTPGHLLSEWLAGNVRTRLQRRSASQQENLRVILSILGLTSPHSKFAAMTGVGLLVLSYVLRANVPIKPKRFFLSPLMI